MNFYNVLAYRLLELARPSLDHGKHLGALVNSMTDSAISKDTATSSNARNMNRCFQEMRFFFVFSHIDSDNAKQVLKCGLSTIC